MLISRCSWLPIPEAARPDILILTSANRVFLFSPPPHGEPSYTCGDAHSWRQASCSDEEYITVAQASKLSGLSASQIAKLLRQGVITGIKPGHDWLLKPSTVMDYLKQERKPGRKR